uniref:Electron transfer flavoprotein regulatory factor 1 n=1 Tax=Aquila chrysaetos chrysaetos TaxID=223781 RepID=A0A663EIE4_AQUCH
MAPPPRRRGDRPLPARAPRRRWRTSSHRRRRPAAARPAEGRCLPLRRCRKAALGELYGAELLLYLGREYPKGADYFRSRLKAAFLKNKDVKDPEKIKQLIARGEFVIKELEALYFLRKYRALKQRYYSDDNQ